MDRRKFLQVGGSLVVGAAFAGVAGRSLWQMLKNPGELFFDADAAKPAGDAATTAALVSPYRRTFAFKAPDELQALELLGDEIVLATPNHIYMYGLDGVLRSEFVVSGELRDMATHDGKLYLLYPARIEVYSAPSSSAGGSMQLAQQWQACSDDADYCQLTVFEGGVFVTDASAKNICQYRLDGTLARFIKSPQGFVVPSYSFAITNFGGQVYCSNPGRHIVEQYTADGEYVGAFGKSGSEAGEFSGCCNPVQLTPMAAGDSQRAVSSAPGLLLTSEKGVPRISCYATDGTFHGILLDNKALGGGHVAYDVRVMGDKLIVAGRKMIQVFQYDERRTSQSLCGSCTVNCPLAPSTASVVGKSNVAPSGAALELCSLATEGTQERRAYGA